MTTEPKTDPPEPKTDPEPKNDPPAPTQHDRLADDHPAAVALKNANKEAETLRLKLKEFEDKDKSELEKLTERASAAEARATAAEAQHLRYQVAAAKGLDPKFAPRLQGNTKEELEADADELAKSLGGGKKPPNFDGGARDNAPAGDMNAFIARAAGRA